MVFLLKPETRHLETCFPAPLAPVRRPGSLQPCNLERATGTLFKSMRYLLGRLRFVNTAPGTAVRFFPLTPRGVFVRNSLYLVGL